MHGELTHLAVNADDLAATRRFYEGLFGWRFYEAYPGFWRTTDTNVVVAVQGRRELVPGGAGIEVTFEVSDVGAAATAAERLGGRVVMPAAEIPGVGELLFVADPGGNAVGGMRYDG